MLFKYSENVELASLAAALRLLAFAFKKQNLVALSV